MPEPDDNSIDIGGLLTIDVGSELRKLSHAQLQGAWQIPAELVRRALRTNAATVNVQLERHAAVVVDNGDGISARELHWTATLLDGRKRNDERHAALTALEQAGGLVLLALAGLAPRALSIVSTHQGTTTTLEFSHGQVRRFHREPATSETPGEVPKGTRIRVQSSDLERRKVATWLTNAARFARARIALDGRPLQANTQPVIAKAALSAPLRGIVTIPTQGDTAHLWLLEYGLVTGHVTVPEAPCFEAAVELGSSATDLSPARLREWVEPHVPAIVDTAIGLLAGLEGQANGYDETIRARVAVLLLQGIKRRLHVEALVKVPMYTVIDAGRTRLAALVELRGASQRSGSGTKTLTAIYPGQRAEQFTLGSSLVLVADATERSRISEVMNLRFRPPDRRDGSSSLGRTLLRSLLGVGRGLAWFGSRIRHPVRARPLEDHALSTQERHFLACVREQLDESPLAGAKLCVGAGPIRRSGQLLLPRDNPTVQAAVAAVNHDPAWIYPATLALLEGKGLPPSRSRSSWLTRGDGE